VARREEGASPQWAVTDEQRSHSPISARLQTGRLIPAHPFASRKPEMRANVERDFGGFRADGSGDVSMAAEMKSTASVKQCTWNH
jgi:hypothetical protein